LVVKPITNINLGALVSDYVAGGFIVDQPATPGIRQYNGTSVNTNSSFAVGAYTRVEIQFTGTTADYVKVGGSAPVTGASAGNFAGGGVLSLLGNTGLVRYFNGELARAFCKLGTPTAPQRAALDGYCTSQYGAGLV
jgi:hypothetical protein